MSFPFILLTVKIPDNYSYPWCDHICCAFSRRKRSQNN